tara:strand:+ start:339 stop:677 length:339 start_codon:yes stop_codon:yes gene_type:complete
MPGMDNRQTRRLMEKMGMNLQEIPDVKEVIIRTGTKEIIIKEASVSEINTKGMKIFQVMGSDTEEKEVDKPDFSEEDVILVSQQANVSKDKAMQALTNSQGDLAKAILELTT